MTTTTQSPSNVWTAGKGKEKTRNADLIDQK